MIERRPVFPGVIELNYQAGYRIGCNVYLVYEGRDWALVDIGYEESVDEIIELVRQMDFPLAQCRALVATHADVDHIQGLAKAKAILKAPVLAHPLAVAQGAVAVAVLLSIQVLMMDYFLARVSQRALWYSGFGVPFFVAGMMVSAFALRALISAGV